MAKTIDQIQTLITEKYDAREIINEIADYLQASPPGGGADYLSYVAIMNQSGTDAPVATVLKNTLGITPAWVRGGAGNYYFVSAFNVGKVVAFVTPTNPGNAVVDLADVTSYVGLITYDYTDLTLQADEMMTNLSLEIRVYP